MDDKTFIITSFRKNFSHYKSKPLVIYGLGRNTEAVLNECKEFNIVALMDGTRAGETFFNLPVIPVEDLTKLNAAAVIIIAGLGNYILYNINGIQLMNRS